MSLRHLEIEGFRNLTRVSLDLSPQFNVITGPNGAGKTSLLEAVHCLARARSFLPIRAERLIQHDSAAFVVRGDVEVEDALHRIAVMRSDQGTRVRLNGEDARNLSAVARYFPIQVITTESQQLLTDGPPERRSFLNWGVFHVEPRYRDWWRRYDRTLRQRNAALRQEDIRLAAAWEGELTAAADLVDDARRRFVAELVPHWEGLVAQWLPELALTWSYRSGWRDGYTLAERLRAGRDQELAAGYTLHGPHRADLRLRINGADAVHQLSRGQQKLAVTALRLAQLMLTQAQGGGTPVVLLDDLGAELDAAHRRQVVDALDAMSAQVFLTAIEADDLPQAMQRARRFHVEQGQYRKVI